MTEIPEIEESAPFFAAELRENYLKLVANACARFMTIEDFIIEIEDLEKFAYEKHYVSKAKRLKRRLNTLQLRFNEVSTQSQNVVDRALLDLDLLLFALSVYKGKLKVANIGDLEERETSKAVLLHPTNISKRMKARIREKKRAELTKERKTRTKKSYVARSLRINKD